MRYSLLLPALLLSACGDGAAPAADTAPSDMPAATARLVEETDDLLEFTYGWPAEASAIPALAAILEADMAKQRAEARSFAREDKEGRSPDLPFHGHYFEKVWKSYGSTPRLLSLAAQVATFTGGAHGNTQFDSRLWDDSLDRVIEPTDLLADPAAAFAALSDTYCTNLDLSRAQKRGDPLPQDGPDWLIGCPPLAERVIVPVDADGNGRFERLRVLIPPYDAGPYAEGTYEIDIPVTSSVRALMKAEYAPSFE